MDLQNLKPGAVVSTEPKLLWVKMIYRPGKEKLQKLRNKYNEILEENLANHKHCYIIDPDEVMVNDHFNLSNRLVAESKITYWKFVDQQIKKFDRQEIDLKPHKVISMAREKEKLNHEAKYTHFQNLLLYVIQQQTASNAQKY